ncbi:MAG: hypothetical protein AVO35_08900 [Candidatus Aegiribacteria sp. MLS_C]|nr:MAG: hypothetical protein AVO35_08900 [Candidatus Aegiribacteria sp. MLS_C]
MTERHVCPVWQGYLLASPLRRLVDNPARNLAPYVGRGMKVLDIGCAMGFYTLPMAGMVGEGGRVVCVDLQEKMVRNLVGRARKKGLHGMIEARVCTGTDLNLSDMKDAFEFALAASVVHEVPDQEGFFRQVMEVLRPEGRLLVIEPARHVPEDAFGLTVENASGKGFDLLKRHNRWLRRLALFQKPRGR